MKATLVIYLLLYINETFGHGIIPENDEMVKSASLASTTSSKQFSVLRDILNQESLVRFSMVQKIQALMMDVTESKTRSHTLEKRLGDVIKELSALKTNDDTLRNENVKLKEELNAVFSKLSSNKSMENADAQRLNDSELLFLRRKTSALEKEIKALSLENAEINDQLVYQKDRDFDRDLDNLENETFTLNQKFDKLSQESNIFQNQSMVDRRKSANLNKRLLLMENALRNLSESVNKAMENIRQNTEDVQVLKISNNSSVCEKGWVSFSDHCYFFSSAKMNFGDALAHCSNVASGAILLEIQSQEEEKWIDIQSRLRGLGTTWIGVTDIFEEKEFVRMSDARAPIYVNWGDNQPDNYKNNEDCVEMHPKGIWNDRDCSVKNSVICKLCSK